MQFSDISLITHDVGRLVWFYETLFQTKAEGDDVHAVLRLPNLGLVIYSKAAAIHDMGFDLSGAGAGLCTINFNCEDAAAEHRRIVSLGICTPTEPHLWPWGATSFRFRDPDGHIVIVRSYPKEQ